MSNQHLKQLTGNENTSKTVIRERMEITETSQCLETLWFCLCRDGVLDLLDWMLHFVCKPWAKPNCQLLKTENVLLKFFAFVKRFSASLVKDTFLAQVFCWEYFCFGGTLLTSLQCWVLDKSSKPVKLSSLKKKTRHQSCIPGACFNSCTLNSRAQ